jgi:choline dehydrogenase-like flavoprotein
VIVQGHEITAPATRRTHTVVVGSGAGGAVVAEALATAGVETVVLEEGGYFRAADFTQRDDEMLAALYRDRAQQTTTDGMINVLQGSCFGGSTVVNTADCVPTPPEVYAHWKRHFGLTQLDEASLAGSQARVLETLGVQPIRPDEVNRNNALVLAGAKRLGLAAGTFLHNRTGCLGSGYCLIGCAYDAKRGANLTYLPKAVAAGADVYTDVRAERIELRGDGRFRVAGVVVERGPRIARLGFVVEADRVVLAAGAIGSPAILHASGLGRGIPELGRNLTLQPQMAVTAFFADADVVPWRGIPQSAYCEAFDDNTPEHGLGGFRLEAISGGLAQVAPGLAGFGRDHKARMARARQMAFGLLLVPDRPSGIVTFRGCADRSVRARIDYRMTGEWKARLRRGLRSAAELYFAAGAREVGFGSEVFPPLRGPDELDRVLELPVRTGVTRFVSAHVQGTCRMGPDPRKSVVDEEHRLHAVPGIHVVDASVMPTSASTHTKIPIMTRADRAARSLVERAG